MLNYSTHEASRRCHLRRCCGYVSGKEGVNLRREEIKYMLLRRKKTYCEYDPFSSNPIDGHVFGVFS